MARSADVIVVGLGAVGSAAAWRLAAAGHRVLGFDRWSPPHAFGSTHGESRVTRVSAWEGAQYVPLVRRANALWSELASASGTLLFQQSGGLFLGRDEDLYVAGSRASADAHGAPYEMLDAREVRRRWPHLAPYEWMVGFHDPGAGILRPEAILRAEHAAARAGGAALHPGEAMRDWRVEGDGVVVTTARGEYRAERLILCTGAWMPALLAPLGLDLRVERTTQHWFAVEPGAPAMGPEEAPIVLACDDGVHATAIFPALDGAVKVAAHGSGDFVTAEGVDRAIQPRDIAPARTMVRRYVPRGIGAHLRGAACLYTHTPSGHFILDRHPEHPQVVLGSPCGGFGFKFSAATGEVLAALATGGVPPVDPTPWRLPA